MKLSIHPFRLLKLAFGVIMLMGIGGFIPNPLQAQNISFGVRTAQMSHPALQQVVRNYNESRPWLDNNLGNQRYIPGIDFTYDTGGDFPIGYQMSISYLRNTSIARGTSPNGTDFVRKVRSKIIDIGLLGLSYYPIHNDWIAIGGYGQAFHMYWYAIKGKFNKEKWVDYTTDRFDTNWFSGTWMGGSAGLSVKFKTDNMVINLVAYSQVGYFGAEYNLLIMDRTLNPTTSWVIAKDHWVIPNNKGIKLLIGPRKKG